MRGVTSIFLGQHCLSKVRERILEAFIFFLGGGGGGKNLKQMLPGRVLLLRIVVPREQTIREVTHGAERFCRARQEGGREASWLIIMNVLFLKRKYLRP